MHSLSYLLRSLSGIMFEPSRLDFRAMEPEHHRFAASNVGKKTEPSPYLRSARLGAI